MAKLLECRNVTKAFGALTAVHDVSFYIEEGEVLGLMGPNGAGKTTLINLIMGVFPVSRGEIFFNGKEISGLPTDERSKQGIGRTYQIPQPFSRMTVIENTMVGQLYGHSLNSMKTAEEHSYQILEKVGLIDKADLISGQLGLLDLKRLELARALSMEPRLILLDEIAGGLIDREVEELQRLITTLKKDGMSMLIIEHVLNVMFHQSDLIMVMNFGEQITMDTPEKVREDKRVIEIYLGESTESTQPQHKRVSDTNGSPLLKVSEISAGYGGFQALFDISLEIYQEEIVALIGLNGAGKTTLIRAITGQLPLQKGSVYWRDEQISGLKPHDITRLGIAQCIEGRKIFPHMTVRENLEIGAYPAHARAKKSETLANVFQVFPQLAIRENQLGGTLSGGEQQMLAIGRSLMALPSLIIFDEVSLGLAPLIVDDLYHKIREINEHGTTILLVEQNVKRSFEMADRAYIIERGRIVLSGSAVELSQNHDVQEAYFGLSG